MFGISTGGQAASGTCMVGPYGRRSFADALWIQRDGITQARKHNMLWRGHLTVRCLWVMLW
jgi:hypothetical protein